MNKQLSVFAGLLGAGMLMTACALPTIPITPETLGGCWEGEAFSYRAKVIIIESEGDRMFTMNGDAKGPNDFKQSINDIQFEYEENGALTPKNLPASAAKLPVSLKVDGGVIRATISGVPEFLSIGLNRCETPAS